MNGDGFYGRQTGDVVLYDEQAWIIEDRYMVRGFPLVDLRDNDGWHQSEVPAWNVKPTEES